MNLPPQIDSIVSIAAIAPSHVAHLLAEGFTPEQIQDLVIQGIRSIDEAEARELNFFARDENGNLASGSGLLLPFTTDFAQLRLDTPIVRKKGKEAKYLTPCRKQSQAMIPEGKCKVYTEGWKDAQAGTLHGGIATGALAGVSHYRVLEPNSGGVILFDADGYHNPNVFRSLVNAGKWINGKITLLPKIPGQEKAGLCEYFKAGHTSKDYQRLVDRALTPEAFLLELPNHWQDLPSDRLSEAVRVATRLAAKLLDPMQRAVFIKKVARATGIDRRLVGSAMARELRQNASVPCKQLQRIQAVESVLGDRIRFNLLSQKIELDGAPIAVLELLYLDLAADYNLELPKGEAIDIVLRLARRNEYHPVREYLSSIEGLHQGDTSILDNLAARYFGTTDPIFDVYMKKSLIGAVARVQAPGCKVDTVPVLQGKQGKQKSSFWEVLAGRTLDGSKLFDDSLGDCGDKDEKMKLYRCWFMEWAELEHIFRRKELGAVKAFLTSSVDVLRVPYGRSIDEFPRQSIIVGTSNEDDFLADPTGDRRYWVIPVQQEINLELLRQERDRIWAAALALYSQGEQSWLTQEEQATSTVANDEWRTEDPWSDRIATYVKDFDFVTVSEVLENAVRVEVARQGKAEQMRVSAILKRMNWQKDRETNSEGIQIRGWRKVEAILPTVESKAISPPSPSNQEVVYGVDCVKKQQNQGVQETRPPRPPLEENLEISEKKVEATNVRALPERSCPKGDQGGLGGLLPLESLQKALQAMTAINSMPSFEEFKEKYERLSNSQQRQVWSAANSETQQNYQRWLDAFLAVPQAVWDVRKALIRVVTLPEMNAIRQQFDSDLLNAACKLIHSSNRKFLKQLLKESKRVQP